MGGEGRKYGCGMGMGMGGSWDFTRFIVGTLLPLCCFEEWKG